MGNDSSQAKDKTEAIAQHEVRSTSDLRNSQKIDILLKEYETLRTEIIARVNNRWSITGYVFAAAGALAGFSEFFLAVKIVIAVLAFIFLLGMWWASWVLIRTCARRIVQIEKQVNILAGEKLLAWETDFGGANKPDHGLTWKFITGRSP